MILVCGEALIDLFVGPPEGTEMPARAVAGGSPFNVAIGLARQGARAAFLGGISRDRFGTLLSDILEREGVDTRFIVRTDRLSTLSAIATAPDGQPSYSFHGEAAADRSLAPEDLPPQLPDQVRALIFGSYTMVVEPVGSAYALLAAREKGRRVISVDPNVRPTVVRDMKRWGVAAERFYRCATIVKASDEDVRTALGEDTSLADAAAYWLGLGARLVVITRGAAGAVAFSAAGTVSVPGREVSVRDTVGAGDTFHAALLARLAATDRLDEAAIAALGAEAIGDLLAYATAAAAVTITRRGADLPRRADIEAVLSGPAALPGTVATALCDI
ncbi:carbohydrate kinase [Ancylobacter sonchi]|uniref:PfkB family carbohydrate kinase n=1 Tax=Ancylobacter sonchi TaxID=1937790 RepID=UPI001BD2154B|nr:PfkB family carbohydrate kinase [Ancylobacter sonchi]MBS7534758.1 carbohydrate kinase [Ancylobacter sonchi]